MVNIYVAKIEKRFELIAKMKEKCNFFFNILF